MTGDERRARLASARLYLCVGGVPGLDDLLEAALSGGVDVVQLRDKHAEAAEQLALAERFKAACARHDALFIVNDRADLAIAAGADGVHVGQGDLPPAAARALVGEDMIVGRSTHSPEQMRAALGEPVDYIACGPVFPTPTKPGRPGVGFDLVRLAAKEASLPWFAIGGIDERTVAEAAESGAGRAVVVRAITEAADPAAAAAAIRAVLERVAL